MLNTHGENVSNLQGYLLSVQQNQLEDSVCKIFEKVNCNIVRDNLGDCHQVKGDSLTVKLSK